MALQGCNSDSSVSTYKFLPVNVGLTPEIIEKAKVELNETPENKQNGLIELERLINTEKDFQPLMDEKFLLRFLRVKKFNPDMAFKRLINFYTYKARYSGILTDICPSEIEHVINMDLMNVMPYRDAEGRTIAVSNLGKCDANKITADQFIATTLLMAEHYLQNEVGQINGMVVIVNMKGVSLRLIRQISSPRTLFRLSRAFQDCLPIRIKAIHLINEPFYFSILFNVIKRFASEKIKQRVQFHGNNFENLCKQVPPEILPVDFGGLLDPMSSKDTAKELSGTDSYFSQLFKYGYTKNKVDRIRMKNSGAFGLF